VSSGLVSLLVALALACSLDAASARADDHAYLGETAGTATLTGTLGAAFDTSGHVGGRIVTGFRKGWFAIEGSLVAADVSSRRGDRSDLTLLTFALDVRARVPLRRGFALTMRLGEGEAFVSAPRDRYAPATRYGGQGDDAGVGMEWTWSPAHRRYRWAEITLLADATCERLTLEGRWLPSLTGDLVIVSVGFLVGGRWR
jgi:hypothetical protein